MLNWTNNPYSYSDGFRTNFRFRHKLGSQGFGGDLSDEEKAEKNTTIRNAYYTVLAGYEKRRARSEDFRHEDRLGNYGYYGSQVIDFEPRLQILNDVDNWGGDVYFDLNGIPYGFQQYIQNEIGEFEIDPNINPVLGNYAIDNGLIDNNLSGFWSDLYNNVGQVYNSFTKSESDIYTFNVTTGFEYLPGGSESGRHNIQIGVLYEQSTNRSYGVAPRGLWLAAANNVNRHIVGVDTTNVIGTFFDDNPAFGPDGIEANLYQTLTNDANSGNLFYKRVRDVLDLSVNDYVNLAGLSPDLLTLDLFAPSELTDPNYISYYGYDYLGNKLGSNVTFDDFFTGRAESNGESYRTFDVAPLKPIYGAAYVQDKFTYKDIIFRLGVRLDYYDANTKVLKDPYTLYDIESANEFFNRVGGDKPTAVEDDWKVYVASSGSESIVGYRKEDEWFLPNGTSVGNNGNLIFDGALVNPSYRLAENISEQDLNIQGSLYDPDWSFDDYDPQLNFMPRLAFSFPITEDANFFAHYDVLVQRPASGTAVTALDYYYFEDPQRTPLNNANLRPEKTIDYEVGFQQKLNSTSALKISLFYKELRDMIQRRVYQFVSSPVEYETRSNLDFGTVKGISVAIERRRTNNLQMNASYTLQFANGTGSDVNSSSGINSRGPIRNLLPFSYDERHRITGTVDYRYGSGKKYNGPRIGGIDIFENTGVNFTLNAVSGRPYTRLQTPAILGGNGFVGSINGARLPWQFNLDARLDRQMSFALGSSETARRIGCNVYIRVSNLLDVRNVIGVYPVTGDAEDDGYLISSIGQDQLVTIGNQGKDIEGFLSSYQWRVLNGGFYSFPRQIFVGAIFDF